MTDPVNYVVDTTSATFEQDVLNRSKEVPVLVDFWAPWCQPCRMLSPLLERLAHEYQGAFILVKANTERVPDIASAFGVQSIPTVYAVKNGEVVDGFIGVQSEVVIRDIIDRLLPSPAERLVHTGKVKEDEQLEAAERDYREAIRLDPQLASAQIGLARVCLALDRADEASSIIAELEKRGFLEPEAEAVKAEIALASQMPTASEVAAARAAVQERPDDLSLRLKLAEALAAARKYEEALGLCLDLVERDRRGVGEEARKTMVNIFQVMSTDSPLANEYRRKLSLAV